jgi:Tfp pilus assembly protein FimT
VLILLILIAITVKTEAYNNITLKLAANNVVQAMNNARLQAIVEHTTTTICPSLNHSSCTHAWNNSNEIIFQKNNVTYKHIVLNNILSSWRASLNNTPAILFLHDGKTAGEQGSISLRTPGYSTSYKITVNRSGNVTLTAQPQPS